MEGVTEQVAAAAAKAVVGGSADKEAVSVDTAADECEPESETVTPDPSVLVRGPSVIGNMRLAFEPWKVAQIGDVDVLDDLPKKSAKEKVRAAAVEIATYEGPIHIDRLIQATAQSFGLERVRSSRQKKLGYQIRQTGLLVDNDKFVWPSEIDPENWGEFRPNDSTSNRPFIHISPIEIANAARFIRTERKELGGDELEAAVLQTFGRKKRTKQVAAHLAKAMTLLGDNNRDH